MKQLSILLGLFFTTVSLAETSVIEIQPGDDVAKVVERAPAGTTFHLHPGIYRMQYARPKSGHKFIAKGDVVFNGATILSGWHNVDGFWVVRVPEKRQKPSGKCNVERPLCGHNEDLFINGTVYLRAASLSDVGPRMMYDDGLDIHIADDPTGMLTELSIVPFAFASEAEGVLIQDVIVEKYASPAQRGAIEFQQSRNWELRDVVARLNHGGGARIGPGALVSGGSFSFNGQLGLGGGFGSGIIVENVEISHNNYAGYSSGWEAGGTKFVRADGLIVRKACIHHNNGPGLWTDIDNINVEFADNLVFENNGDGIKHEISYRAKIHGNTVVRNGYKTANWLWGSQILIQNSQDVEVHNNMVEVGSKFGNGISVINQNRGEGRHGSWVAKNNSVRYNTIIHLAEKGMNGTAVDHARDWFNKESKNKFDFNTYIVPNDKRGYFHVENRNRRFSDLPAYGMEMHATVKVETRKALELVCPQTR